MITIRMTFQFRYWKCLVRSKLSLHVIDTVFEFWYYYLQSQVNYICLTFHFSHFLITGLGDIITKLVCCGHFKTFFTLLQYINLNSTVTYQQLRSRVYVFEFNSELQ